MSGTLRAECAECRTLLGGYLLDALEPDEQRAVAAHLEACADCAREAAELAPLPALLQLAGEEHPPLPALAPEVEEAVIGRFAGERAALARRRRSLRRRRAWPLAAATAAAAAAAVVVALTLGNGPRTTQPGEAYRAELTGAGGARADARLTESTTGTRVRLRVAGLRGAAPGSVYELWCVRGDGARISAGTFRPDRAGRADVELTTAATPTQYRRVRVERYRAAAGAGGQAVLAGTIG